MPTKISQRVTSKFVKTPIHDAVDEHTHLEGNDDPRVKAAFDRFMHAGDEWLEAKGVSINVRGVVARVLGFFGGLAASYWTIAATGALMTAAVAGGYMFIAYCVYIIGLLMSVYAAFAAYVGVVKLIDSDVITTTWSRAKSFFSVQRARFA